MEGSPVFGEQAQLIGILTRPLQQKTTGAEIQVTKNPLALDFTQTTTGDIVNQVFITGHSRFLIIWILNTSEIFYPILFYS